jgi:hypothetical protein
MFSSNTYFRQIPESITSNATAKRLSGRRGLGVVRSNPAKVWLGWKFFCRKIICPCGVAQWSAHPPEGPEDPGSNPARVHVYHIQSDRSFFLSTKFVFVSSARLTRGFDCSGKPASVTRRVGEKIVQNVAQPVFLSKLMHHLNRVRKQTTKTWSTTVNL